ncbi:ATP-binding protein [Paenibacillus algorifonticola]|uniref:AAA family ATPase n=1 Tax=Paenibacillus algorifonticola TaxID=684063 RepID=UPI003D2BC8EA
MAVTIMPELKKIIDRVQAADHAGFKQAMNQLSRKFVAAGDEITAEAIQVEAEKYTQRHHYQQMQTLPTNSGISMGALYTPAESKEKAKMLVLSDENDQMLGELLEIYESRELFFQEGIPLPTKLLLFGPPGTGKTISAYYLAYKLQLPLVMVRLDTIIASHLGETATNIRKIFEYAKKMPCVVFMDEFDAIARKRGGQQDVQEMSRVVNTLLQCMDEFNSDGVIMAATNLNGDIDPAVSRRFDTKMTFLVPGEADVEMYIRKIWKAPSLPAEVVNQARELFKGCTFAEIEQVFLKAKRKAILRKEVLHIGLIVEGMQEYFPEGRASEK